MALTGRSMVSAMGGCAVRPRLPTPEETSSPAASTVPVVALEVQVEAQRRPEAFLAGAGAGAGGAEIRPAKAPPRPVAAALPEAGLEGAAEAEAREAEVL